jgi:hypothetical protein
MRDGHHERIDGEGIAAKYLAITQTPKDTVGIDAFEENSATQFHEHQLAIECLHVLVRYRGAEENGYDGDGDKGHPYLGPSTMQGGEQLLTMAHG